MKKIIIISIISVFLLMMMPSISAVEHQTLKESIKEKLLSLERPELIELLKEKLESTEITGDLILKIIVLVLLLLLNVFLITVQALSTGFFIFMSVFVFKGDPCDPSTWNLVI